MKYKVKFVYTKTIEFDIDADSYDEAVAQADILCCDINPDDFHSDPLEYTDTIIEEDTDAE